MSLGNQTQHIALKHKGEKMNPFLWKMAGHAHPPPAPVMTGPTMTQIEMADKYFNHSKQPRHYHGQVPHHFFSQINSNHQPSDPSCILKNKGNGMQGPTGTCIIRRWHLKLALLTHDFTPFYRQADKTS